MLFQIDDSFLFEPFTHLVVKRMLKFTTRSHQNASSWIPYRMAMHSGSSQFDATQIAEHYNARPELGVAGRQESRIIGIRSFNNWVKAVLINQYARNNDTILDFCCGKGGDLQKWKKRRVREIIGVDIAQKSVEQARDRYENDMYARNQMDASFFTADCFSVSTILFYFHSFYTEILNCSAWCIAVNEQEPIERVIPDVRFDIVSCQFAFHYSFESEQKACMAFRNASLQLKHGGYFIMTIPNAYKILKRLQSSPTPSIGNSVYRIQFENKSHFPAFGAKYTFHLESAIDECPEFLVHPTVMDSIARSYGLRVIINESFPEFYTRKVRDPEWESLAFRMNVWNPEGTISNDEWDVIGKSFPPFFQPTHNPNSFSNGNDSRKIFTTSLCFRKKNESHASSILSCFNKNGIKWTMYIIDAQ